MVQVVNYFPQWGPGFNIRSCHAGVMIYKVPLGQVFFSYWFLQPVFLLPAAPYLLIILSSMLYSPNTDSIVK
jgi:hypothetical protein